MPGRRASSSSTTATGSRAARSARSSCSCGALARRRGGARACSSAARRGWAARARPRRCCAAARTRRWAGGRACALCRPTWSTCTTCSRSIGPRGAGGGARRRRPRGAPPPQPAPLLRDRGGLARRRAVLSLPRPADRSPGCVLNCRGSLPESAAYAAGARAAPAGRARRRGPLRGAEPLGRRPARAARAAGRADGGAAALPPGRARSPHGSSAAEGATRWWRRACRRRRAIDVAIRASAALPACRCGWPGEGPEAGALARAGARASAPRSSSWDGPTARRWRSCSPARGRC